MQVKILKTVVLHGEVHSIGSVAEMPEDAIAAFGPEYVQALGKTERKPEKETDQGQEATEPEKKSKKK